MAILIALGLTAGCVALKFEAAYRRALDFDDVPAATLATILRDWLVQYPERVLFGSDAFANGPDG